MASAPTPTPAASSGMSNNVAGLLCYLPVGGIGLIISIVFLLVEPYKNTRFVRFHALQSIFLHVASVVIFVGLFIVGGILGLITKGLGWLLTSLLAPFVGLGLFVLIIVLMIKAYGNQEFKVPVIGDLASKQAGA
jgi:uncharacterized membrane protein